MKLIMILNYRGMVWKILDEEMICLDGNGDNRGEKNGGNDWLNGCFKRVL